MGSAVGRGALVTREDSRTAPPYSGVTSRQFLPIQPKPARVATVLWGSGVRQVSSWVTASVVWALACQPRASRKAAPAVTMALSWALREW